jgi:hypothetical protein
MMPITAHLKTSLKEERVIKKEVEMVVVVREERTRRREKRVVRRL